MLVMKKISFFILLALFRTLSVKAQEDSIHKEVNLKEVRVEANNVNMHPDHTTYMPTQQQKNVANSGINLLYNLMIPQLTVDRVSGSVESRDKRKLAIYKDGMPSTIDEIKNIRPKDVIRVEYYSNATDKFPNEENVVNFIIRKYESGGYVDVRTETSFLNEKGDYKAIVSVDRKKMNYTVQIGTDYQHDHAKGMESEEMYSLNQSFTKYESPLNRFTKNSSYYALMRAVMTTKKSVFQTQLSLQQSQNKLSSNSLTSYSDNVYPENSVQTEKSGKDFAATIVPNFYTKLNDKQTLKGNFSFSYGRNTYDRMYAEGTLMEPINNYAKENKYGIDAMLTYDATFNNSNGITIPVAFIWQKSSTAYGKSIVDTQSMNNYNLMSWLIYHHQFFKKLTVYFQAGVDLNSYKINSGNRNTKLWFRPGVNANYAIDEHNNISFYFYGGNNAPDISYMNSAVQRINQYEVKKGNKDLKTFSLETIGASYMLNVKPVNILFFMQHNGFYNMYKEHYYYDDTDLVQTAINNGDYHTLSTGMQISMTLLKKSLSVTLGLENDYQKSTGINSASLNQFVYNLSAIYYYKNFSFTGWYSPAMKYLTYSPCYTEKKCNYGVVVNWKHKALFVELGCSRMFEKHPYSKKHFDFGVYRFNQKDFSDILGRSIYVKLSYDFDFGRKIEHKSIELDAPKGSNILKV